jgi:hypothetical protein
VAAAKVTATFREFVPVLVGDQVLPDDIRIAIARRVPAERSKKASTRANKTRATEAQAAERNAQPKFDKDVATTFARLDLLLSIVRDEVATEAGRRSAASDIAEFFLPKAHGRKRAKFPADEFGFSVDPQLAKEFRDIRWKMACLALEKDRLRPDTFAKKVSQCFARLNAIRQVLQPPDPSKYSKKAFELDEERVKFLRKRRASNHIFSPEEDMEEARRIVRLESCLAWPEKTDRARLEELHQKKLAFDKGCGVPLRPAEATRYRYLSLFYPPDPPPTPLESLPEYLETHPFVTEWPYPWIVGNPNYPEPS